jgi:MtN3 and saliva related transmembrane protein
VNALTALGLAAATLTTCSFVPQLTRVVRTRSADDLSYGMFGAFSLGVLLWLVYGVLRADLPVILSNAVTLALSVTILVLKVRYDPPGARAARAPASLTTLRDAIDPVSVKEDRP